MHREKNSAWKRIALVGTYVPRRCGIATFTQDLAESLARAAPWADVFALAVTEGESEYPYPPRVRYEIREQQLDSYQEAADFLNASEVDIVCVQHEYGIYGGPAGSHLLHLLNRLDAPVITTLHTVLRQADPQQRRVLAPGERSEKLVVMTQKGRQLLREIFHIPEDKIAVIPHGIPDWPFVDPNFYKDQFGLEGKLVLLTFGLLSANKGIENVLLALLQVVARFPQVCYVVLGATHPNVRRIEGEAYREKLLRLTEQLGLSEHVRFVDRFVELEELLGWLSACDVYITPYLNQEQITSGTLAYSVGLGKAVISTPYWHAEELLAEGRGVLVPFRVRPPWPKRSSICWTTRPNAMPCGSGLICTVGRWSGRGWRKRISIAATKCSAGVARGCGKPSSPLAKRCRPGTVPIAAAAIGRQCAGIICDGSRIPPA